LVLGGAEGSQLLLPTVPSQSEGAAKLGPPEPEEERKDIRTVGFPWPGEWILQRDEGRQRSKVLWKGKSESHYPWGKEIDLEDLTYEIDDAHPALNSIKGEAETTFQLKDRVLIWRGHLFVTSDEKNFFYKYTREVLKDGKRIKQKAWQETIARDHQ